MDNFFYLVMISIVIEALVTYVRTLFIDKVFQWQIFAAMLIGIVVTFGFNIDLFAAFAMQTTIPYLGVVLTGILVSRGSNFVFDLIGKITKIKVSGGES